MTWLNATSAYIALPVLLIFCYLLGSIPSAYLSGKFKGIDIREHGSGNVGASNTFRTLGKSWGLMVLLVDIAKGFFAVFLISFSEQNFVSIGTMKLLSTAAVIIGHVYPIWLRFKGGKGVATGLGALLAVAWLVVVSAVMVFIGTLLLFRIMSLGSILAAISLPFFFFIQYNLTDNKEIFVFMSLAAIFIVYKHSSNIKRLLKGEEPKLSFGSLKKS